MIRNVTEIANLLLKFRPGQVDVINNRTVLREGDSFLIEGSRKMAWNTAAERLSKVRGK